MTIAGNSTVHDPNDANDGLFAGESPYRNPSLPDGEKTCPGFGEYSGTGDVPRKNAADYDAKAATFATVWSPVVQSFVLTDESWTEAIGKDLEIPTHLIRSGQPSLGSVSPPVGALHGAF